MIFIVKVLFGWIKLSEKRAIRFSDYFYFHLKENDLIIRCSDSKRLFRALAMEAYRRSCRNDIVRLSPFLKQAERVGDEVIRNLRKPMAEDGEETTKRILDFYGAAASVRKRNKLRSMRDRVRASRRI